MQEELLQFQLQKVWTLVDLPNGKRVIPKRGIDYDEVFAPVARIEAIRLFFAYASFMGFIVYPMDVKSAFLYGTIDDEVYVYQPPGFEDPQFPDKVYKVEKALYGLHQAPRAWFFDCHEFPDEFYEGNSLLLGFQVHRKKDESSSQGQYVANIIFNHIIKDCDFHDKKMVQKLVLNNVKKGTGQREARQVWNNAMRVNHQNFSNSRWDFAPTVILTKSGIVPISDARQSSLRVAAPASAARPINTATPKPFVNVARPRPNAFHKSHSPSRTPFNQQTALKNRNFIDKVNTAKVNSVNTAKGNKVTSAVGEQGINAVKSSACWIWKPKGNVINHISKDSGSYMPKRFDYVNPQGRLNGCSKHMTRNKFYLSDYQDIDGGFVAFGGKEVNVFG
ncbi:ribonuclease H-like domain-containing protein [Tanacetum coccineum]